MILTILSVIVGIAGVLLLSYGAWLMLPALGFIVGGGLCLGWSFMVSRSLAENVTDKAIGGD